MQGLSVKQSEGSGCQTGQLKKSEGKKKPQKQACTKIQKSYKKGGIKRKKENSNQEQKQTAGIQQRVQRGRRSKCLSGNCDKRRKKMRELSGESPRRQHRQRGSDLLCPCPGRPV